MESEHRISDLQLVLPFGPRSRITNTVVSLFYVHCFGRSTPFTPTALDSHTFTITALGGHPLGSIIPL